MKIVEVVIIIRINRVHKVLNDIINFKFYFQKLTFNWIEKLLVPKNQYLNRSLTSMNAVDKR